MGRAGQIVRTPLGNGLLAASTLAVISALSGCGSHAAAPPTWSELRTTYKPLLTKDGLSKGCNFAPGPAQCFTGVYNASQSLQSDVATLPESVSKSDVQHQIDNYAKRYNNYLSGASSDQFSAIALDVSALGIWRALLQAQ